MSDMKRLASDMVFESNVAIYAKKHMMTLEQAKAKLADMSFSQYVKLAEAGASITPPSGSTIGPSSNATTSQGSTPAPGGGTQSIWPGKGAPLAVGMTVGLKGPNGLPVPGQVSQVDMASKGVKVKNPTTGQEEWQSTDNLNPYMANGTASAPATSGTSATGVNTADQQPGLPAPTTEDAELTRILELAGIKEDCSGGATGAGAIAIAPTAMGKMQKRQSTEEEYKAEYTRTEAPKTIVGDTKPFQASGKLSADLVANGKKAAGRTNNGMKKKR